VNKSNNRLVSALLGRGIVEFYIEGGWIRNFNIDLISHEIYFSKQAVMAQLEPTIFLCYQTEYAASSEVLREGLQMRS